MDSSTLHFRQQVPGFVLSLVMAAVAAWFLGAEYSLCFNPENKFFVQMAELQDRWARKMDVEHGHKVAVIGGSNVMFSIVGEQLVSHYALPVVNMGVNASLGAQVMTERAVAGAHPGDTLILAFESGLLTESITPPTSGIQFSYAMHHSEWVVAPRLRERRIPALSALLALRPGGYHAFLMIGKLIAHNPHYKYRVADASPSGWSHTAACRPLPGKLEQGPILSDDARGLLRSLRDWADRNQVHVAYSLPWQWTPREAVDRVRKGNAEFLLQISEYFPVLRDPIIGADPRVEDFSDSIWHLNEESSVLRTEELGRQLTNWDIWQPDELRRIANEPSVASPVPER